MTWLLHTYLPASAIVVSLLGTLVVCWRHDARQRPPHWTGQPVDRPACRILPFRRLVDWEREGWSR